MVSSDILQDKLILAVDDEEDVLDIIEEELSESANITLHRATTFERAQQYLVSYTYDLVILDIMGVRGFDLLQIATNAGFPVVMLTAHAFTSGGPEEIHRTGRKSISTQRKAGLTDPFPRGRFKAQLYFSVEKSPGSGGKPFQQEIRLGLEEI